MKFDDVDHFWIDNKLSAVGIRKESNKIERDHAASHKHHRLAYAAMPKLVER